MVEQVDDAGDPELGEHLRDLRPDARHRLDLREQRIEDVGAHRRDPSQKRRGCLHGRSVAPAAFSAGGPIAVGRTAEVDERLRAIKFRAHHRGTREADFMIGGFFDAHHASVGRRRARLVRGAARRAGRRHHGLGDRNRRGAGALSWSDARCACRSSISSRCTGERAAPEDPQGQGAADPRGRARGLPAVAGGRPCARAASRRAAAGGRWSIAADEAAMRALAETAPIFAPDLEVRDPPRLGLPALRPRLARAPGHGRAAGRARAAAGKLRRGRSCWSRPPMPRPSAC